MFCNTVLPGLSAGKNGDTMEYSLRNLFGGRRNARRDGVGTTPEQYMLTQQELVERMREWAVRVTPQRLAIAEVVLNSQDHPTVQQIYERVRDHFPSMTLATIYSTLGVLQRSGLIQELPFQRMSRYEPNMDPHVNLVCIECENVVDADTASEVHDLVVNLRNSITNSTDFEVGWQRVDFYGLCPRCSAARRRGELAEV